MTLVQLEACCEWHTMVPLCWQSACPSISCMASKKMAACCDHSFTDAFVQPYLQPAWRPHLEADLRVAAGATATQPAAAAAVTVS